MLRFPLSDCYVGSGIDYRGFEDRTERGTKCVNWLDASHYSINADRYPDAVRTHVHCDVISAHLNGDYTPCMCFCVCVCRIWETTVTVAILTAIANRGVTPTQRAVRARSVSVMLRSVLLRRRPHRKRQARLPRQPQQQHQLQLQLHQ